jgi:hypothetical protein
MAIVVDTGRGYRGGKASISIYKGSEYPKYGIFKVARDGFGS